MSSTATKIEWTDATWNPIRGCSRVSEGCRHCYAERIAARFSGEGQPYEGLARTTTKGEPRWTGRVRLLPEKLDEPLRWRKPRMIFVNSMSDLFHPDVPDAFIDRVFAVMALAGRHRFQILTKRPGRMAEYAGGLGRSFARLRDAAPEGWSLEFQGLPLVRWPIPNVWLGTSVEDQATADERIPHLLETPAAVRFLSCEPLLGPIDLYRHMKGDGHDMPYWNGGHIGWVIVGGESGPHHRPMDAEWARTIRDQCVDAGVAFFFKQWGGPTPKSGGRLLDDHEWNQMPT